MYSFPDVPFVNIWPHEHQQLKQLNHVYVVTTATNHSSSYPPSRFLTLVSWVPGRNSPEQKHLHPVFRYLKNLQGFCFLRFKYKSKHFKSFEQLVPCPSTRMLTFLPCPLAEPLSCSWPSCLAASCFRLVPISGAKVSHLQFSFHV